MGDSIETQEKIIKSAMTLFAQQGYHGTTTSQIAKDCGVSEGTIFRYYKTKKILLDHVLNKIVNEILPNTIFSTSMDPIRLADKEIAMDNIKQLLLEKIMLVRNNFDAFRVVVTELQYHEDLKMIYTSKIIPSVIALLEDFYNTGVQLGVFRRIDSHIAARTFMGSMAGMVLEMMVLGKNIDLEKELDIIFDILLNGIASKKEGVQCV